MTGTATPFGLRAVSHPSGTIRMETAPIASGYATNLFEGCPVAILADGTLGIAAAGARAIGCFLGVRFVDTDGRPKISNRWVASAVGTDIVAGYSRDPDILYEIQANAAVTQLMIGQQFDWTTATTGNATTGLSTVALDVASSAANAGLQVVGFNLDPDNLVGDAFTTVQVRISEHQLRADVAAF